MSKHTLTNAQQAALDFVTQSADKKKEQSIQRINRVLVAADADCSVDDLINSVRPIGKITTNFHPDRLIADGRSVIAALYEDGIYKSQFETKISNGGLTAFNGGDRDLWEEAILGGAYQKSDVKESERPKYGGLNLMNYTNGACPRFGSCHFVFKPEVLERCTYTFGDSVTNPEDVGTIDAFEPVLAALLETVNETGNLLGKKGTTVSELTKILLSQNGISPTLSRALDDYIETQIHGDLHIASDVEALVVDPSFRGTATGELLQATADKYGFPVVWYEGFELTPDEVTSDFRGPEVVPLAKRVVENYAIEKGYFDAATLGIAAVSVVSNPDEWADHGSTKDTLQHLKCLWHTLVAFGKPKSN